MPDPAVPAASIPEDLERRLQARLLDVLIRFGLLSALVVLCFEIFHPFLSLMAWALILAVSLYPLHQRIVRGVGGRQGAAATILIILCVLVIVTPTAFLLSSFGDSVRGLIDGVQNNTLQIPAPKESVQKWPMVGPKIHGFWTQAHDDLPGFVLSLQPKIGDLAKRSLSIVASIGGGLLMFLGSLVVAGILMAYGQPGSRTARAICDRVAGPVRGEKIATLSTATVRTVAQGVLGVAFIQAMLIGITLLIAGVPWAGLLSAVALVFAIAQLPTFLVTIPAIAYLWMSGHYGTTSAVICTVLLIFAGVIDNILKPFLLGRGVDAPMPVILLGALGGMVAEGILGMFVGAVLLALGYQLFMGWVATVTPEPAAAPAPPASPAA